MTTQEFAEGQAVILRVRLLEEFPDHDTWVGLSKDYRAMEFRVVDCTGKRHCIGKWGVANFGPEAIEETISTVRSLLG